MDRAIPSDRPRRHGPRETVAEPPARVAGVILAAGRSTRMGRPKTTLMYEGKTLLDHAIDNALAARLEEVIVVARPEDAQATRRSLGERSDRVVIVSDEASRDGLGASLRIGLAALSDEVDAAAILLADQPGVDAALIDRVIAVAVEAPESATRPVFLDGSLRTPGHPVVLRRRLFAAADSLRSDAGARALFADDPSAVHELEIEAKAPPDVDSPRDYQHLIGAGAPHVD